MGKKIFVVTRELLCVMLTTSRLMFVQKGLPKDSKLLSVTYDPTMDQYQLLVESDKFKNLPEGCLYPNTAPTIIGIDTWSEEIVD